MEAKLYLLDIYNVIGGKELVSDKGRVNCEARQRSFAIGLVQTDKLACSWQEPHGENYMYTFGF
jgi:hypothetical protein